MNNLKQQEAVILIVYDSCFNDLFLTEICVKRVPDVKPHRVLTNKRNVHYTVGTAVAQWLRCCATNRKVAGSIPDGVIGIFH